MPEPDSSLAGFSRALAPILLAVALVSGSLPCLSSYALARTGDAGTSIAREQEKTQALSTAKTAAQQGQDAPATAAPDIAPKGTKALPAQEEEQARETDTVENSPYSSEAMALWPDVDSFVTSRFGERRGSTVPLLSDAPMRPRFHSGLDVRGHLGWPVRTLRDGTVLLAGMAGSAGLTVKIAQTNGKTVSYAHLGKVLVKKGDKVKQGQHIGEVGCTGRTSGAHVHVTVRNSKGERTDPRKEIKGLWELYDPPLEDLKTPLKAQACIRRGGYNKRLAGQKQYLRMRKALIESGAYRIPDIEPWKN